MRLNPVTVVVMLIMTAYPSGPLLAGTHEQIGKVKSGGMPIEGSTVTLYRAGPDKDAGAVALGTAQSGAGGHFNISYTPPLETDAVLYLVADGPESGIRLATVLGTTPYPNIVTINERTTVATAYAMAQFIVGGNIGGSAPGLPNASATLQNLVDLKTGNVGDVLRKPPNGTKTSTMGAFNSLANILAACVNGHIDCLMLFVLATPPGGPAPEDTLQAAVNIAHRPWQASVELFMLSTLFDRYKPALRDPPLTWTLALKYVGNGHEFDGPGAMAFDADGNVWANNNYTFRRNHSLPSCASDVLSKLTPTGEDFPGAPYTGGGLSGAGFGIALDPHGNVWVGNFGFFGTTCPEDQLPLANSVSLFTSDGVPLSPDGGFTNGSIDAPQATVSDQLGNIWIANQCGGSVTQYQAGNPDDHWIFSIDDAFGVSNAKPFGIAIDVDCNGWVTDNRNDRVIELSPDGVLIRFSPDDAGIKAPMGVAIDSLGNVWVANSGIVDPPCAGNAGDEPPGYGDLIPDLDDASVTLLGPDGIPVGEQPFQGGGMLIPWGIAVDGNDNIWVANFDGKRVSQLRGANGATWPPGYETGDPIAPDGYHSDALTRNTGVSIDPSGNVWLTNNWLDDPLPTNPGGDGLVVFIGLAAPVKTPLIGPPQQP